MNGDKGEFQFQEQLHKLLACIVKLISLDEPRLLLVQGACLKYLPSAVSDIIKVFDPRELRYAIIVITQSFVTDTRL